MRISRFFVICAYIGVIRTTSELYMIVNFDDDTYVDDIDTLYQELKKDIRTGGVELSTNAQKLMKDHGRQL